MENIKRSAGILLPIFSLPSPYGIGTLGKAAYDFIDFLECAEQRWWQILPLGPTSHGDSPYQSFSSFAGNPYFIDLDLLCAEGLLQENEIKEIDWGKDPVFIDYEKIYQNRFDLLAKAKQRGWKIKQTEIQYFISENRHWLMDYALYMALKRHFDMKPWMEWPQGIRMRRPETLQKYREKLAEDVELFLYIQYLFYQQWNALREYAKRKGIRLIGDIPIYVAMDSVDVWAESQWFQLSEDNVPLAVAGVPPDAFTADGQLWGNPLYDWDAMQKDGYGWWIRRVDGAAKLYDALRIDHFRGMESYWSVPYGDTHARNGRWIKGPGTAFLSVLKNWFPQVDFIAEDLGYLTAEVETLLKDSGFPGMKILQFAFDTKGENRYLPYTYPSHCVCYTGTHDNMPLSAWQEAAAPETLKYAARYFGISEEEEFHWEVIRGGMCSAADLFVAQMQDYLGLGAETRVNTPGTFGENWRWRLTEGQATEELAARIADLTRLYGRSSKTWQV